MFELLHSLPIQAIAFTCIQTTLIWRSFLTQKRLQKNPNLNRIRIYKKALILQCFIFLTSMLFGGLHIFYLERAPAPYNSFLPIFAILGAAIYISFVIRQTVATRGLIRRNLNIRQVKLKAILPTNERERRWLLMISISAGISEEVFSRGWVFSILCGFHVNIVIICVASAILFGLMHAYQGKKGIITTGMIGYGGALLFAGTGNLILPILFHAAFDITSVSQHRWLLKNLKSDPEKVSPESPPNSVGNESFETSAHSV